MARDLGCLHKLICLQGENHGLFYSMQMNLFFKKKSLDFENGIKDFELF